MHPGDSKTEARKRLPTWLIPAIGYAVSTACLIWVFLGVDWSAVLPDLVNLHWGWVALAIAAEILIYGVQAWRWNLLLRPIAKIPLLRSARAIYIGLFASDVLPLRPGEVIRAYLQAHWSDIPFGISLSSVVIERILDGIFLVLTLVLTAALVDLPKDLVLGGRIFGVGVLIASVLLGLVMFWKQRAHAVVSGSRWAVRLRHLVDGLHAMGTSPSFYGAVAVSLAYSLVQVVPIYALMRGFGLDLSLWAAWVVLLVQRLGTVVPQMPGNLGTSQFFFIKALELFGVGRADASNFSLIAFSTITLPLVVTGFIALSLAELDLFEIHRHAHSKLKQAPTHAKSWP